MNSVILRSTPMVVMKHETLLKLKLTMCSLIFVYLYNALKMHIGVLFHRPITGKQIAYIGMQ